MNRHTYPDWDSKGLTLPARSRLYNLEPIGVGTIKVESLTGYVARLAEAHCISNHTLLHREAFCSNKEPEGLYQTAFFGFSSSFINGVGKTAQGTATALCQLTSCQSVADTTMLKWKSILSASQLLRKTKRWCPSCYAGSIREEEPVYDPLIFAFDSVSSCPWHSAPLSEMCPECKSQLPMLTSRSRPGYCSKCGEWLGKATTEREHIGVSKQDPVVDLIGELLIHGPSIVDPPTRQGFMMKLAECIDKTAGGSINTFAHFVGIWSGAIRRLVAGESKPRLEILFRICSKVNIPILDLLSGAVSEEAVERRRIILGLATPMRKEPVPWIEVEGKLREALEESPPPSMEETARRMGYYQPKIRYRFPELCSQIVSRHKEHLKNKHPDQRLVRRAFRAALEEQPPPSLQSVLRRLGCRDTGYFYYQNYPDLCSAVANRFKSYKTKSFDIDFERGRLEAALVEDPAPSLSELAKRLGRKRDFLRRKFPELTKAIVTRHLYYRTSFNSQKAETLRDAIREAVKQIVASGLYVSERRVKAYVSRRLASTGRSSLFKQALREIKSEMGIVN